MKAVPKSATLFYCEVSFLDFEKLDTELRQVGLSPHFVRNFQPANILNLLNEGGARIPGSLALAWKDRYQVLTCFRILYPSCKGVK